MATTPRLNGKLKINKALEGKVRRYNAHYLPTRFENPRLYFIRKVFFSGLDITEQEPEGTKYWDAFNKARNLFFTDLNIKHVEMNTSKKLTPTLIRYVLKHDR